MKQGLIACLCLVVIGCGVRGASPIAPQPSPTPIVSVIPLGEITAALADEVPVSVCDSDQLQLVVDDLVIAKKLTQAQASQVKQSLGDISKQRPLTDADAALLRAVK